MCSPSQYFPETRRLLKQAVVFHSQGYLLCLLFFGGFIIRQPSMPAYWRYWAPYGDFMSHAWHAQMVNEFGGRPDALLDGVPILEFYNVRGTSWANLGFEATFFVGFFCFAWLVRASFAVNMISDNFIFCCYIT